MTAEASSDSLPTVLTIVGPTAVGKTSVAVCVAAELGGEVVSADSRQIYRGMDVGTAKPDEAVLSHTPHHLIDIADPSERYDASRFAADAERVIGEVLGRGATPLVVGGTGFYVLSLFEGLFEGPGRNREIRAGLESEAERLGSQALHGRLCAVDPEAAARVHPNDTVRIVRALEVHEATGRPMSDWHEAGRRAPAFRPWYVVLTADRQVLYERIERRVDEMIGNGLLEEVERLLSSGALAEGMPAADAVGYRELIPAVSGETDLAAAVEGMKRNTRRYAKRQLTWFSRVAAEIVIDMGATPSDAAAGSVLSAWRSRSL
jgi:tRNA dimethylallyltransferase